MAKTITEDGEIIDVVTHEVVARPPPFFKTPHNHDTNVETDSCALACKDPSKTQQQFAADADINNILRKFMTTGDPNLLNSNAKPNYLDIEAEFDLQDQMVTSHQVDLAWNALPIQARAILQTPAKFVEWYDQCLETGNVQGLRDIGLIPAETKQEAPPATIVTAPPVSDGSGKAAPAAS